MTDVPPEDVESEFGVPIPGTILPPEQWASTALKRWPQPGPLDVGALFGRTAPLIVEIGCGNGRYSLQSALARPECLHLATDPLPVVIRYATRRGNQRGLSNLRFGVIDGVRLLRDQLSAGRVRELHIYHPQPYYTRRERRLRLITPAFLALAHSALEPGGLLVLQTDHPAYWEYMQQVVPRFFDWEGPLGPWPDAPAGRSRREILARSRGLPIFRGQGRRRDELPPEQLTALVQQLPFPTFDADRSLLELDRLE